MLEIGQVRMTGRVNLGDSGDHLATLEVDAAPGGLWSWTLDVHAELMGALSGQIPVAFTALNGAVFRGQASVRSVTDGRSTLVGNGELSEDAPPKSAAPGRTAGALARLHALEAGRLHDLIKETEAEGGNQMLPMDRWVQHKAALETFPREVALATMWAQIAGVEK